MLHKASRKGEVNVHSVKLEGETRTQLAEQKNYIFTPIYFSFYVEVEDLQVFQCLKSKLRKIWTCTGF